MSSSTVVTDYKYLTNPLSIRGISKQNANHLKRFIAARRVQGVKLHTINSDVLRVANWIRAVGVDDVKEWNRERIIDAYLDRLDEVSSGNLSGVTLDGELIALKTFWRFLFPDAPPLDITKKKTQKHLESCQIVSKKQIIDMRNAAEAAGDLRAAALIMTVFGTGCRISELLDANVGDVDIGQQAAMIKVSGKTGFRVVPFVTGLPELQTWLNMHPIKGDPDAPLFVTYDTRGHGNTRLNKKTVETMFKKYGKRAGIPEDVKTNPHALRHRAASEDDRFFTHQEMCLKFGWSFASDMPKRYTHSDLEELQRTILNMAGVDVAEEVEDTQTIIQCPRCKHINAAGTRFCSQCSLPLDKEFEVYMQKARNIIRREVGR